MTREGQELAVRRHWLGQTPDAVSLKVHHLKCITKSDLLHLRTHASTPSRPVWYRETWRIGVNAAPEAGRSVVRLTFGNASYLTVAAGGEAVSGPTKYRRSYAGSADRTIEYELTAGPGLPRSRTPQSDGEKQIQAEPPR